MREAHLSSQLQSFDHASLLLGLFTQSNHVAFLDGVEGMFTDWPFTVIALCDTS
jgi:hypothetical protein